MVEPAFVIGRLFAMSLILFYTGAVLFVIAVIIRDYIQSKKGDD